MTPSTGKGYPQFVQQKEIENGQNEPVGRPAALPEVAQHMHHPKNPHRLRDPDNPGQQQSAEQESQGWAQVRGEWHETAPLSLELTSWQSPSPEHEEGCALKARGLSPKQKIGQPSLKRPARRTRGTVQLLRGHGHVIVLSTCTSGKAVNMQRIRASRCPFAFPASC